MVLVSSNPTNLVISSASKINFIYFSGWTILPALISAIVLYPLLMWQYFRSTNPALVPRVLETPEVYPRGELNDVRGAIFKACLLGGTLLALIVSSVLVKGLYVWWVTVPAALIAFARDIGHDIKHASLPEEFANEDEDQNGNGTELKAHADDSGSSPESGIDEDARETSEQRMTAPQILLRISRRFPTVWSVVTRMPWPLLPFAFSFFILVESLSSSGWINVWAGWMSKVVQNNDVVAIFFTGFICILLCNVGLFSTIYTPRLY
jgi:Na+/H+ antiporter NhaD/arsenite permease-like protein